MNGWLVDATCKQCDTTIVATVSHAQYTRFMARERNVQRLFPKETPDVREVLLGHRSGYYICPECWETFNPDAIKEEE